MNMIADRNGNRSIWLGPVAKARGTIACDESLRKLASREVNSRLNLTVNRGFCGFLPQNADGVLVKLSSTNFG